jgi:hypothetical protein
VSGVIQILGGLDPNAIGYDIQVSEGLRPMEWILIAEGQSASSTGKLADWSTEGLSGIWAIQLQSWDADGRITRAYTVVSIK